MALDMLKDGLAVDVVALDVKMPKMDGLEALKRIMSDHPMPVVMISSLTLEGATHTFECLDAGAVDFIGKPDGGDPEEILRQASEILDKLSAAARARMKSRFHQGAVREKFKEVRTRLETPPPVRRRSSKVEVVVLGASTGGPVSIMEVIPRLPADLSVPVLMVQHMPPGFTASFANRMNEESQVTVVEAQSGDEVKPGTVYLAPGGIHMTTIKSTVSGNVRIRLSKSPTETLHCPSVNVLFESAAKTYGAGCLAVVMTGMGDDGADGCEAIKNAGGEVLSEHESTCIIYGMPQSVEKRGLADETPKLGDIAAAITRRLR